MEQVREVVARLIRRAKNHDSEGSLKEGLFSLEEDKIMGLCVWRAGLKRQGEIRKKTWLFGWSDTGTERGGAIPWLEVLGRGRTTSSLAAGAGLRDSLVPSKLRINGLAHNSVLSRAFGKPDLEQAG